MFYAAKHFFANVLAWLDVNELQNICKTTGQRPVFCIVLTSVRENVWGNSKKRKKVMFLDFEKKNV